MTMFLGESNWGSLFVCVYMSVIFGRVGCGLGQTTMKLSDWDRERNAHFASKNAGISKLDAEV